MNAIVSRIRPENASELIVGRSMGGLDSVQAPTYAQYSGHNIHMDNYLVVKQNIMKYIQNVGKNLLEEFDISQKHVLY